MTFPKALFLVPLLAACTSTVTSPTEEPPVVQQPIAQQPIQLPARSAIALEELIFDIDDRALADDVQRVATMPASGRATYRGAVQFKNVDNVVEAYSAATLQADFAKETMGGVLYNFVAYPNEYQFGGEVNLVNGMISNGEYSAELDGYLSDDIDGTRVQGGIAGEFWRDDASLIDGIVSLYLPDWTDDGQPAIGVLLAEK